MAINGDNKDAKKRGVFTKDQLQDLYKACLTASKDTRLILLILGETGARLAEIVRMRWGDVCLTET
ncbi:tyrosine-type recombinase/integrase [Rhodovulum sulfidophilum]|uniref:tyrosine-type recombinase/integrase n=1 Tax=Rhodovulum sulfidophilum TaxID=35806 RepID=UPI00192294FD|nr:tyrosine-type recombinase/integrase [Rhodovulum sulfidophilum]